MTTEHFAIFVMITPRGFEPEPVTVRTGVSARFDGIVSYKRARICTLLFRVMDFICGSVCLFDRGVSAIAEATLSPLN